MMISLLAWRPFLDPLPLDTWWLVMLLPLIVVVSIVYKTIKLADLKELPRQSLHLSLQIIIFMVLAAAALWLLTEVF